MDRQLLVAAWAQTVAEGKDKPTEATTEAKLPAGYDPEMERERLQWEKEKFAAEMQMRERQFEEIMKRKEEKIAIDRATLRMQEQREADEAERMKKICRRITWNNPKTDQRPNRGCGIFS